MCAEFTGPVRYLNLSFGVSVLLPIFSRWWGFYGCFEKRAKRWSTILFLLLFLAKNRTRPHKLAGLANLRVVERALVALVQDVSLVLAFARLNPKRSPIQRLDEQ